MKDKIYTFHPIENQDNAEVAKYTTLYVMKLPALNDLVQFIWDGCHRRPTEITEATLDDAFDCVIYRDQARIYASGLSKDDKKHQSDSVEAEWKALRDCFKSSLKVKDE
ncbi:MAG: hypothetical protein IJB23_01705 [Alistipes sp.]|nr:hypothetical protein [Alistipes sp.]